MTLMHVGKEEESGYNNSFLERGIYIYNSREGRYGYIMHSDPQRYLIIVYP